ncbi:MAG: TetR family transcriptional regulator [Chloroflexi bacterium]|nr:TetR family transcriptional regulator [Chloroflexota bacterium]
MRTYESTQLRRQEIIDCARRIIAARGMEGLTTKELARAVGITQGDIYRHFGSKKEVLLALIDDIEETLFERIQRVKEGGDSPLEQLENVLLMHLSYAERRRGISFLVVSEVLRNDDRQLRRRMRAVVEKYLKTVEGILAEGVQEGQVDAATNVEAAALALFGLAQGAVTLGRFAGGRMSLAQRHQALWRVYTEGIACRGVGVATGTTKSKNAAARREGDGGGEAGFSR